MGYVLLEGGAEFGGRMRDPDLRGIERAGGFAAPIRIIPAAAAPDDNHQRAGNNGIRWFQGLGAENVRSVPLIDKTSANDDNVSQSLRVAKLIYVLGGFTHYLGQTLKDSLAWQAVVDAYRKGAVVAGSSAGAMVMCQMYFDPGTGKIVDGLNLVPNSLVLPHHDTFGKGWATRLVRCIPDVTLIGIDEQTGMLNDGDHDSWNAYGAGQSRCIERDELRHIHRERRFRFRPDGASGRRARDHPLVLAVDMSIGPLHAASAAPLEPKYGLSPPGG